MDKETAKAISEFEKLGLLALTLKEASEDIERRETELKDAEKRKKDAEDTVASATQQVAAKQAELTGLENSILIVQERLNKEKGEARANFDAYVAGIKGEERAIDTAIKKKQKEQKDFEDAFAFRRKTVENEFAALVSSHDKWKKEHGLA